ncbi:MAG: NYN domain-containing protein, partial [Calditrichaceae bacterium]
GYNLGYKLSSVSKWIHSGDTDRAIQLIKNYVNQLLPLANQVILVFDGTSEGNQNKAKYGKLHVIFSQKPQTADDIIRQFIRSQKNASQWIVISSDSEIRFTAEDMGAKTLTSEKLIASLKLKPHNSQPKANKEKYHPENIDVNYWLNKFNQSGE